MHIFIFCAADATFLKWHQSHPAEYFMHIFPLVSVVTCSYNNSRFVIETLDSIKDQTYSNIELVIVDDCSTDNSVELINEWLKSYQGKYHFLRQDRNLGGSKPYNIGLRQAMGKYYCTVDTDDVLLPDKITNQVALLEATDDTVAAVYSDAWPMDVNGVKLEGKFIEQYRRFDVMPSGMIYETLLQGNFIPTMSLLVKRCVFDKLGLYDESLVYGDFDMWLRVARDYQILYSDTPSARYRIRPGSLTFTIKNWEYSNLKIFLKHKDGPLSESWIRKIARWVYFNNDAVSIPLLYELGLKTGDRFALATSLLYMMQMPVAYGEMVLGALELAIYNGLPARLELEQMSEPALLVVTTFPALPQELRYETANVFPENKIADRSLFLREVATASNDRYFLALVLLEQYNISGELADSIRDLSKGQPIMGLQAEPNTDCLFAENFIWVAPMKLLKKLAYHAYSEYNERVMKLIMPAVARKRDRYLKTILLLWKLKINSGAGAIISDRIDAYCAQGKKKWYIDLCIYKDVAEAYFRYNATPLRPAAASV